MTANTSASPHPGADRDGALTELRSWLLDLHGETVDADRLRHIRSELERVVAERVPGAIVELGCPPLTCPPTAAKGLSWRSSEPGSSLGT